MMPAKQSTLIAKSKEDFSAYNLLDTVGHFLLLRTLHTDSKDHLLVLLLLVWLLFLSLLHGLFLSIPCHPMATLLSSHSYSLCMSLLTHPRLTETLSELSPFAQLHHDFCRVYLLHEFLLSISLPFLLTLNNVHAVIGLVYKFLCTLRHY